MPLNAAPHPSQTPQQEAQPVIPTTGKDVPLRDRIRHFWTSHAEGWAPWMLGFVLAAAVILAYSNTLHGPFQYDDFNDIQDNPSIRHLWPIKDVFFTEGRGFLSRPVANLTFALNYAMGGFRPFPYHLTNLAIHVCAALALFGTLRRTLSLPTMMERFSGHIAMVSLLAAALWALHPLQTESVSYITQRYESLTGLFSLLTFYCVLRSTTSPSRVAWPLLASLSCLLALGSKEVAVSVPLLVLIFDVFFISGSFKRAWNERRLLYVGLLFAWACFAFIQLNAAKRTFAGFDLTLPWWRYALNQPPVILHYLRLAVWPHPLNFDYLWPVAKTWGQLLPGLIAVGSLLGLTLWALIRKSALGFLAAFFFLILAPTSSVMPILDLAVEHRMYLPLAPVIVFIVITTHHLMGVAYKTLKESNFHAFRLFTILIITVPLSAFGILTYLRNEDYQNTIDLWRDAVIKSPDNPRAHHNYAFHLAQAGYSGDALRHYAIAIERAPGMPTFRNNYGVLLGRLGQYEESLKHLRIAVQLEPDNYRHYVNLGGILLQKGSLDNAIICYEEAIRVNPKVGMPYSALASALLAKKQPLKALGLVQRAILMEPDNPEFRFKLGLVFLGLADLANARSAFDSAIRMDVHPEEMSSLVGLAYHDHGLDAEAVSALRQSLRQNPDHTGSRIRLAWILATSPDEKVRDGAQALAVTEDLLRQRSTRSPELLDLMAVSLAEVGRFHEACAALKEALAQSATRQESWVPNLEKRLALFERGQAYREAPRSLISAISPKTGKPN